MRSQCGLIIFVRGLSITPSQLVSELSGIHSPSAEWSVETSRSQWYCRNLLIFFGNFLISQGSPFNFFHILQPTGVSQSPKGPPFTILKTSHFLSLKYSADFGSSGLFFTCLTPKKNTLLWALPMVLLEHIWVLRKLANFHFSLDS